MNDGIISAIKQNTQERRELTSNLYRRSIGESASAFKWDNPEDADGVPILAREKVSESDPNIKTAFDNFALIQNTKAGYMGSMITRLFSDDVADAVRERYESFDQVNNTKTLLKEMMTSCAGWGNTYSLCFIEQETNIIRMCEIDAWSANIQYDPLTKEPLFGLVFFNRNSRSYAYHYDKTTRTEYELSGNGQTVVEAIPHGFTEIPLIEFVNNDQRRGNAQKAVSLLDAYDRTVSDNSTEQSTFRNAYLMLRNMGTIDDETKKTMQKTGVIVGSGDAQAEFITKDINPEFAAMVTQELWSGIWIVSSSVDPRALSQLTNATAFQIGQMYRLLESDAQNTESKWLKSLEYLDRVLKSYWTRLATPQLADYNTFDINYDFKRSLPTDVLSDLEAIKRAGGDLPQYYVFMRSLGIDESRARELATEASEEMDAMLPDVSGE